MKKLWCGIFSLWFALSGAAELIPQPKNRLERDGVAVLNLTAQCPVPPELARHAAYLKQRLECAGMPVELALDATLPPEGYRLELTPERQKITGADSGGVYNGIETLLSLVRNDAARYGADTVEVAAQEIFDYPGVRWRAIDFQWCYRPLDLPTMLAAVRAGRGLKLNAIVPEFGPMVRWCGDSPIPHATVRAFLQAAAEAGLTVIPKSNALGHSDRGFPWPVLLGAGLDTRAEANYEALFAEVRAWKRELAAVGLPMPYFHFGMDEASDCIAKNVERYQIDAAELVAAHLNRIAAFCREEGITGIIYHDMLIGSAEPIYWRDMGTPHADLNHSYLARPQVDRGLVLDYWNYEGFDRYRSLEGLHDDGFRVFLTPWGGTSPRKMAKNAALYGEGLIGSTWCDFNPSDDTIPLNSIYNLRWVRDGIVDVAEYGWNPERADTPSAAAGARLVALWRDRTTRRPPRGARPQALGDRPAELVTRQGVPFDLANPLELGGVPCADYDARQAARWRQAALPLAIEVDGRAVGAVTAINGPAQYRGLTLYTRAYGPETAVDIYSTEARLKGDRVYSKNDWGVGHTPIPRRGVVLSGWGEANYGLTGLPEGARVTLRDANGVAMPIAVAADLEPRPLTAEFELSGRFRRLHLLHGTQLEGEVDAPAIVTATVEYADGTVESKTFRYGLHLTAPDDSELSPSTDPGVWAAHDSLYAYTWELDAARPVAALRFAVEAGGENCGYRLLALTAEE